MGRSRGWQYATAAFWIANGLNHFRAPRFYEAIVPPPFDPWKREANVASGAAEVVGGLAVLPDRTRPAARWWLLATLLAVYWANVHMALRPEKFPRFQPALLYARLPMRACLPGSRGGGRNRRGVLTDEDSKAEGAAALGNLKLFLDDRERIDDDAACSGSQSHGRAAP